ncbi:hypothetical protein LXL04_005216 [Taraxacum kok-saghyz]
MYTAICYYIAIVKIELWGFQAFDMDFVRKWNNRGFDVIYGLPPLISIYTTSPPSDLPIIDLAKPDMTRKPDTKLTENRSGRLLKSYLKNIFKITVLHFLSKSISFILSESLSCISNDIIALGLSTQRIFHLNKPTSKLPVPNTMGQKRSKNKC